MKAYKTWVAMTKYLNNLSELHILIATEPCRFVCGFERQPRSRLFKGKCVLLCNLALRLLEMIWLRVFKGQLNSEWIFAVIVSFKLPTKNLKSNKLPGQKSFKFMVGILWEMMTSKIHSEFNWPLALDLQQFSPTFQGYFSNIQTGVIQ